MFISLQAVALVVVLEQLVRLITGARRLQEGPQEEGQRGEGGVDCRRGEGKERGREDREGRVRRGRGEGGRGREGGDDRGEVGRGDGEDGVGRECTEER